MGKYDNRLTIGTSVGNKSNDNILNVVVGTTSGNKQLGDNNSDNTNEMYLGTPTGNTRVTRKRTLTGWTGGYVNVGTNDSERINFNNAYQHSGYAGSYLEFWGWKTNNPTGSDRGLSNANWVTLPEKGGCGISQQSNGAIRVHNITAGGTWYSTVAQAWALNTLTKQTFYRGSGSLIEHRMDDVVRASRSDVAVSPATGNLTMGALNNLYVTRVGARGSTTGAWQDGSWRFDTAPNGATTVSGGYSNATIKGTSVVSTPVYSWT